MECTKTSRQLSGQDCIPPRDLQHPLPKSGSMESICKRKQPRGREKTNGSPWSRPDAQKNLKSQKGWLFFSPFCEKTIWPHGTPPAGTHPSCVYVNMYVHPATAREQQEKSNPFFGEELLPKIRRIAISSPLAGGGGARCSSAQKFGLPHFLSCSSSSMGFGALTLT